jgi:hypothetical protein
MSSMRSVQQSEAPLVMSCKSSGSDFRDCMAVWCRGSWWHLCVSSSEVGRLAPCWSRSSDMCVCGSSLPALAFG